MPLDIGNEIHDYRQHQIYSNLDANLHFLQKVDIIKPDHDILEIGCGIGALINCFYKKGYNILGLEINAQVIQKSRSIYGQLPISLINTATLPFNDASYNVVMSFDVFEHIPDSDLHVSEVYRVLKPNGYYLLQTPNKYYNALFETIRWKSFTKWKEEHCSLHSYTQLKKRFKDNGFELEFIRIPVVNTFFKTKIRYHMGYYCLFLLNYFNPDYLPTRFKTNFYLKAGKI